MRRITTLVLAAVLVVGASSVSAESQPLAMLQASPSPPPAEPSRAPAESAAPGAGPSVDPCASPAPLPSPSPAVPAGSPIPSVVPASPVVSAAPSPVPSTATASVVPGSPAPSAIPARDPCAGPEGTDEPGAGFQPGRVKLKLVKVADGLDLPVYVTGTGDGSGRLFVVQREGRILILDPRTGKTKPFLDITDRVDGDFGERGLHAIALDPKYAKNGRFYVHYNGPDGDTRIVRFTGRPGDGKVKTGTAKTILRLNQPYENHNGGWIGFGPDGMLYITLGDGGGNTPGDPLGNGQDKGQPLAKILRIDVDGPGAYDIPRDNPYPHGEKGFDPRTFVWGLRNPWRASFDRRTGDLWIGDVGQNASEEIDLVRHGKDGLDFGWSVMEGSQCHRGACDRSKFTLPVTEYSHGADGCSVVGGYVYRGEAQPLLQGAYLFSDFCSMKVWGFRASDGKAGADLKARQLVVASGSTVVSFGEADDGELYLVSLGGGIYHIVAKPKG